MGVAVKLFEFKMFSGMNNVDKTYRLPVTRDDRWNRMADMHQIENLDIDNTMGLASRVGSVLKVSGTDIHSMWSNGGILCLYVDGTALYRLTPQYTAVLIGTIGGGRVSYAPWDDKVYLTNGTYIGYYRNDTLSVPADTSMNYKRALPAGRLICYYRGRLYVAKANVLYISDALSDHYDTRKGYRTFENDITMLVAVENGLYVADGKTWFIRGGTPEDFTRDEVSDSDAIPYTAEPLDGKYIGDGLRGVCAMWTSADGIMVGDGDGKVRNVTRDRYAISAAGIGGSVVRNVNNTVHFITSLE